MGGILLRRLALGNNLHVIYNQLAARRALVTVAPEAGGEDYRQFVFIPGKIDSGEEAAARSVRQKKADGSRRFRQ